MFLESPRLAILCSTTTLWILFVLSVASMIGFALLSPMAGGTLLDGLSSLLESENLLAGMSAAEKNAHFWITLLVDIPFPLFYGALFLGVALKYGGKYKTWLTLPALLVIPADLIENFVQLLALKGVTGLLPLKVYVTPLKFFLFRSAAGIALLCLVFAGAQMTMRKLAR